MKKALSLKNSYVGVYTMGCLLLLIQVLLSPPIAIYDEIVFHPNLLLYQKYGFSEEFLLNFTKQAPGPLYQMVHSFFSPLTHAQFPAMRYLNFGIFGATLLLLYLIAQHSFQLQDAFVKTLSLITVPLVWTIGGIALTEAPSMFFCLLFLLGYFYLPNAKLPVFKWVIATGCGICLALAILGRTQFLMIFACLGLFTLLNFRTNFWLNSTILLIAFAGFFPVFWIWKGLLPPALHYKGGFKLSGFNFYFGFLALAYSGLVFFILEPTWFYFKRSHWKYYAALLASCLIINLQWSIFRYLSLQSLLFKIGNERFLERFSLVIPCFFVVIVVLFLYSLYHRFMEQRTNQQQLFIYACYLLIMGTFVSITHIFSPRYVVQALPLAFLMVAPYFKFTRLKIIIGILGILFGAYSLHVYYLKVFVYG